MLPFLTKILGASAIRRYAETGFLQENTSFQESVGNQKPDFFDAAASASPLLKSFVQQIVAADPVTAPSIDRGRLWSKHQKLSRWGLCKSPSLAAAFVIAECSIES
ncbi:hypothetical protein QUB05_29665 [Microcoleus sp. F10-C6]|uniref:hypothetical protein n=1 Tax=unclassified Microcoleus TaxID=2642155 RepID=UPI002FD2BA10